jgi:uncharacterized protein (DUF983 family)
MSHQVVIGDRYCRDDGLELTLDAPNGWDDCQAGACPDCGGEWVWYEAGYVPGTRRCNGCGSMFSVFPSENGRATMRRERFYTR